MNIQVFWIIVSTFILHSSQSKPIDLVAVVNDTNNLRRKAAEEFEIPYMHELIYDEMIEDQQFDLIDNDGIPWFTPRLRDFFSSQLDMLLNIAVKTGINSNRKKPLSEVKDPNTAQHLSPLQKRIRCLTRENGTLKCVLGPIRETMWWYYSEGSPGSKCDDDYYNNEGLCTRFQTTTTRKKPTTTSLEIFWQIDRNF